MSASGSTQKTCMECGTDVSAKPRVKDAQGRYLCAGECQRKYQARVPAAAARPPAPKPAAKPIREPELDSGMLSNLIADSPMMTARRCESCGNPLLNNAVLCLSCGFNVSTGKAMKTRVTVEKIKEPKAPKVKGGGARWAADREFGPSFGVLFLIVFVPLVAFALLGAVNPIFVAFTVGLAWLGIFIGHILGIVAAFRNDESGWGLCGILSFILPIVGLFFLYYLLIPNSDKWSKSITAGSFAALLIGVFMLVGVIGIDAFEQAIGTGSAGSGNVQSP